MPAPKFADKLAVTAASPASARRAASMSRLVTPLMAETTTTTEPSAAADFTIAAERAMQAASPTEVPPNFITRRGGIRRVPSRAASRRIAARPQKCSNARFHTHDLLVPWSSLGLGPRFESKHRVRTPAAESSIVQPESPRRTGVRRVHAHNRALMRGISCGCATPKRRIDSTIGQI